MKAQGSTQGGSWVSPAVPNMRVVNWRSFDRLDV